MARKQKVNYLARAVCGNCKHWQRLDDADQLPAEDVLGACLRYPPTVTGRDESDSTVQDVPIVEAQHRCGEHAMTVN